MRVLYKAQKFYGLILKEKSVEKYLEKLKKCAHYKWCWAFLTIIIIIIMILFL